MKKTYIPMVAGAILASTNVLADATVYGRINLSLDSLDNGTTSSSFLASNASRLGVKGSTDFENGLSGIYQLESGVNMESGGNWGTSRDSYLGLKGGFGTLLGGRLPVANQYIYDANLFADQVGDVGNFTGSNVPGRADNALHYVAPAMGNIGVALTYRAEQGVEDTSATGIRVTLGAGDLKLGLTNFSMADALAAGNVETVTALSLGYDFGAANLKAMVVQQKGIKGQDGDDRSISTIGASFPAGNGSAKLQYTIAGSVDGAAIDNGATMTAVGYDYSLYDNATLYVSYATVSNDDGGTYSPFGWGHGGGTAAKGLVAGDAASGVSVGFAYNF